MALRAYGCTLPCIDMLEWRRLLPWGGVVEELGLATTETLAKPAVCGLVQKRETVEKGDSVFRKGVEVIWQGVEQMGRGKRRDEEEEEEGEGHDY